MTIKGQALADFIAKFTYTDTPEIAGTVDNTEAAKLVEAQRERTPRLQKEALKSGLFSSTMPPMILDLGLA